MLLQSAWLLTAVKEKLCFFAVTPCGFAFNQLLLDICFSKHFFLKLYKADSCSE